MKWPDRLPIGGLEFQMKFVPANPNWDSQFGVFAYEGIPEPEYLISDILTEQCVDNTVLHEWSHSLLYQTGLGDILKLSTKQEEAFCNILATNLKPLMEKLIDENCDE